MKALLYFTLFMFLAAPALEAAPKKCGKYKTKLDTIQKKQRQANSVKRSNKLKEQEQKAFKTWRKCKQGKLK